MTNASPAECATTAPSLDLRAARERRGVSLERISLDTKIPRSLLEALESGDLDQFPQGIYARAYARAYAAAVGLSSDAVLAALADRLPGEESLEQIAQATPRSVEAAKRLVSRDRSRRTVLVALVAVAGVWSGPRSGSPNAEHSWPQAKPSTRASGPIQAQPITAAERAVQIPAAPSRTTLSAPEKSARTPEHRRTERRPRPPTSVRLPLRVAASMAPMAGVMPQPSRDAAQAPEPLVAQTLVTPVVTDVPGLTGSPPSDAEAEQPHTVGRAVTRFGRGLRKAVLRR